MRELIDKWRSEAEEEYQSGQACDCQEPGYKALRRCADELEAKVSEQQVKEVGE